MSEPAHQALEALFDGTVHGVAASLYENERPLQGLAGLIDWRFEGAISRAIQAGFISGKPGECAYVPVERKGRLYHVLLAGGGTAAQSGARAPLPDSSLRALEKNIAGLRLKGIIGVLRSDLGNRTVAGTQIL